MSDRHLRARVLLEEAHALGLDLADLIAADTTGGERIPTLAAYIDAVAPTFTPATAATYRPYWRLAAARLGDRRLVEITTVDLAAVVTDAAVRARQARLASPGRASQEHCVATLRALFRRAAAAGLITANPAAALTKPRRARGRRRALDDGEVVELIDAVRTTSRDPDLDLLVLRFHLESGARREGALNLRRRDIDMRRATVWLREKGGEREQPVSPALAMLLGRHAAVRSALDTADGAVFRTIDGDPMSARRYDTIFRRARSCLEWSDRTPVSAHVLRHTAVTAIGRLAGYPVAQAFAGHAPPSVTGRYLHATLAEVATAVATLTGQAHPLGQTRRDGRAFGLSDCGRRQVALEVRRSYGSGQLTSSRSNRTVRHKSSIVNSSAMRGEGPPSRAGGCIAHDLVRRCGVELDERMREEERPSRTCARRRQSASVAMIDFTSARSSTSTYRIWSSTTSRTIIPAATSGGTFLCVWPQGPSGRGPV